MKNILNLGNLKISIGIQIFNCFCDFYLASRDYIFGESMQLFRITPFDGSKRSSIIDGTVFVQKSVTCKIKSGEFLKKERGKWGFEIVNFSHDIIYE